MWVTYNHIEIYDNNDFYIQLFYYTFQLPALLLFYSYHVNETINIMLWPIIVIQYHFTGGIQHFLILHQMNFTISSLLHLLHWQRMRKHTEKISNTSQLYQLLWTLVMFFQYFFEE